MRQLRLLLMTTALGLLCACGPAKVPYDKLPDGVLVRPEGGPAKAVRLKVVAEHVIRVTAFPDTTLDLPASLMAVPSRDANIGFDVRAESGNVVLSTDAVVAEVSLATGSVKFRDKSGAVLLAEADAGRSFQPTEVAGQRFQAIRQQFESPADEAFYGLGQHQNGQMNYKGENVELAQHNMDVAIPFVVSSRNYGLLWDNPSITRFGDPRPWQPISATLKLYDAQDKPGGLTATYFVNGKPTLTRIESDLDYQYIKSLKENFPPELKDVPKQKVVWEGSIQAATTGTHKFTLYASDYHKLWIDGTLLLDAWRQNWNPWYRNFELEMSAGKPRTIRIEWDRSGGYLALQHRDPLPPEERDNLSFYSELGHAIDYYFIKGANADEVIAGYRLVTGKATMLPKWAYGFWQSRERYKTQDEIVGVVKEYRKRGIPIDNIVQDWFYWKEDSWGSHEFDPERFPDPKGMVEQIHGLNARLMISVWPKFYPATDNFKELDAKGHIYRRNLEQQEKDWVGPGYHSSFYDPYSEEARSIFWRQVDERLNKLDVDAWWLDATEPDPHSNLDIEERKLRMGPTAMGPGAQFFNSYPLLNAQGVYEGDRAADPDKRVFILTRSAFAGLQRYAAATWSGDVVSRWSDLAEQISAGINFSMSGTPNWTTDIGGFSLESRYEKPVGKDLDEWRELNTRWFQFSTFTPLFRSHGQTPYREIYNLAPAGSKVYATLVDHAKLRYRLMPYIYTLAADTYHRDYTMMRGLIMDFPADPKVRNIGDQFMFGPSLLICPVHEYGARSREVYLPAGVRWYDFRSGELHEGGSRISAPAPLEHMPIFVRAGAIVPIGPAIQYTDEKPGAPILLQVYTGADGAFTLYEDAGTDYGYEKGAFSRIEFSYAEDSGALSIGARAGEYPGMPRERIFQVRWITPGVGGSGQLDAPPDQRVEYSGASVVVRRQAPR
jgi:alpha-D-xyloside xylohydrolase